MTPLPIIRMVLLVIIISVTTLLVVFGNIRRLAHRRGKAMQERFPDAEVVIPGANFFGLRSEGVTQMRGNGTFIVTDDKVVFEMWVPRKEIMILRGAITGIETPQSFLGKTRFKPLLQINFTNGTGKPDAAAWDIGQLDDLVGLLRK